MKRTYPLFVVLFFVCCNTSVHNSPGNAAGSEAGEVPAQRTRVDPNPIKTYSETVKSFETTDEFKVSLFETKNTFRYLIKIQYKQMEQEDTLRIPNFGVQPSVEIIKGDIRPSCVIGFFDQEKKFRESKLIYFEDDKLKVKVLKHYAVYQSNGE